MKADERENERYASGVDNPVQKEEEIMFSMLPDGIRNASTRKVRRKNQTTSATTMDLVHSQSQTTKERVWVEP